VKVSWGPRICSTVTDTSRTAKRVGTAENPETMTVPKKQSTAAKKVRAAQRQAGGKHTVLLAAQTCGSRLQDHLNVGFAGTLAGPPHDPQDPCSADRDFDIAGWKARVAEEWAAEEARRAALTPEERAEEDERDREWEYDEMRAAAGDFDPYDKYYGDVD
jgi:hypothetical protein